MIHPSLLFMTSNHYRHKYISNVLADGFDLKGIVIEPKLKSNIKNTKTESLFDDHFDHRRDSEIHFFKKPSFPNTNMIKIDKGKINSPKVFKFVKEISPDLIILFGTSIIKSPLLSNFKNKIINVHLGLSPYYRGSGTNLWPLFNNEPECVGATVHLAEELVDAGKILHQIRPDINKNDNIHGIGNKTILALAKDINRVIFGYYDGTIKPVNQLIGKKVYKKSDFSEQTLFTITKNFKNGMLSKYIANQKSIDDKKPIVKAF